MRVALLGATGSIGTQALDVIDRYPEQFEVLGLTSGRRPLDREPRFKVGAEDPDFEERVTELVTHPDCDLVLVAIPGVRSLRPTLRALEAGKVVAFATKEVLVMAGDLVMDLAGEGQIRPVDSEHSAIWQCLWGESRESVSRIVLTASGGPFWSRPELDWDEVTVEQALNHPRWSMGPKVTIDSATLINKGLELIEAHYLFGVDVDRIQVVVHRQSVIHSMVEFCDGSTKAQLGNPDMRLPIAVALAYPRRLPGAVASMSYTEVGRLDMEELDGVRFPSVGLAREAGRRGAPFPAVFNAADEEAVEAFRDGRLRFSGIVPAVESALEAFDAGWRSPDRVGLDDILAADAFARSHVHAKLGPER
ncbi:MAG TPA: 1-deoxy-D-xylulose-5-phosphate reductoisomerase [Candidatus Dormibacteraeota bacterium]|nr:1-deoxy-D-xylulose-5-phosphate reductoisomerase [Candidatus Dormibacteraeota bacterium]